ncbi:MAG: hypothetical protein V4792_10025 [Pseudomonadota bacterium]
MIPTATSDVMLDAVTFTQASLHTAFPGTTGTSEVSGGAPAYARKAITINASSGASRALNSGVTFDVPASTIRFIGYWNAGVFLGCAVNGGATPLNFMSQPSTDLIYSTGHGYADTATITFVNGTPPAPLVEGTTYFVRDQTADTFKVAATSGGVAIDLTAPSSFGCVVCAITEQVYAIQATHTLSTSTIAIPT